MTAEEQQQRAPDCCSEGHEATIARHFDNRDYSDAPMLHATSARLLDQLRDVRDVHPAILELGSGAGALAVALLEDGADRATGIDLSPVSVDAARRHAEESGVTDRASFSIGDAALAELEPHDWVVMDRVICCYPDMARLLRNALPAVRGRLAVSVPESRGMRGLANHVLWRLEDAFDAFRGDRCQGHVHDIRRMHRFITDAGLRLRSERPAGLWYTAVFERT
jgi:2-polyprenyl-3-methyl-5-hydroxy-6-metoxy-1,4-benzoquinol methylase